MDIRSIHVGFEVTDFPQALRFWTPLLETAGLAKSMTDDLAYAGFTNGTISIFIAATNPPRVVSGRPTGEEFVVTDHVGLSLARREDVDAIAAAMERAGFEPLFPAREYTEFGPGFYAVTFIDHDNNVIEFGHRA